MPRLACSEALEAELDGATWVAARGHWVNSRMGQWHRGDRLCS